MESGYAAFGGLKMAYIKSGEGKKALLCFHGFGRRAEDFLYFSDLLDQEYCMYSFYFFHHGRSEYPGDRIEKNTLRPEELDLLIRTFLREHNIERFSVMGYSMGGKIALSLLKEFHRQMDELYLLAPDGIKTNFWYRFTSRNRFGTFLYRRILHNPEPLFRAIGVLRFLRLISDKLARFVKSNLETREKRELVYKVWLTLREIDPPPRQSAALLKEGNVTTFLIYGRYDQVILSASGKKFASKAGNNTYFAESECGHNMFNENTRVVLQNLLRKKASLQLSNKIPDQG